MRLLFVNQFYWPDCAATAQMLADLCEHLARAGHEPHVLCSRGHYAGPQSPRVPRHEVHQGVHIHRLRAWPEARRQRHRLVQDLLFHISAGTRTLATAWRYDAIVSLTTPPLIGVHGALARCLGLTRHVTWCMDLYPDIAMAMHVLPERGIAASLLRAVARWSLRRSDAVVALGQCMADRLRGQGLRDDRIAVIPVWAPESGRADQADDLRRQHDLAGKFIVMYSGNAGMLHTFDSICAAALALRDDPRFAFVFSGGGRRLQEIEAFRDRHQLGNVRVLPYAPREQLASWLAVGGVHLVTLRQGMQGLALPSKLYGILAAARPVIFIGPDDSDTARTVRDADCGHVLDPRDSGTLVTTLRQLADNPALCRDLGTRARLAHDQHHTAPHRTVQWLTLLQNLTNPACGLASSRETITPSPPAPAPHTPPR
jgi:glycosyltransferase involved in cell wall biosynthesis